VCSPLPHSAPADRRLFFSGARGAVPRRPEAAPPSVRRAGIRGRASRNALDARSGARLGPVAGYPAGFILHGSRGMRTCATCLSGRCPRVGRWLGALYRLARKNPPLPPSPPPFGRHGGCWAPMPWRGHGKRRTSPWPGCESFSSRQYGLIIPPQAQPPRPRHCRSPPVPPPSFAETFRPRWRTVTRAFGGPPPALRGRGARWEPGTPLPPMHPGG